MKNKLIIFICVFMLAFSTTAFADISDFSVQKSADTEYRIVFNLPLTSRGAQIFVYGPVRGEYDAKISLNPSGEWKDYYLHYARQMEVSNNVLNADFNINLPNAVLVDAIYVSVVSTDGDIYHISADDIRKMPGVSSLSSLEITDSNGTSLAGTISMDIPSTREFKTKIVDIYGNLMTEANVDFSTTGLNVNTIQLVGNTIIVDNKPANEGISFNLVASYDNLTDTVTINVSDSSPEVPPSLPSSPMGGSPISAAPSRVTSSTEDSSPFKDLNKDAWYYDNIINLYELGIIYGSDGMVNPDASITRQEICALISRALDLENDKAVTDSILSDGTVSDWAKASVSAAVKAGIITGDGSGNFNGIDNATREQTFVMLARAFGITESEQTLEFADTNEVSQWALKAISGLCEEGYVKGDNKNNLSPKAPITRAEFCAVLDRLLS